jgi:hypothetical protein
MMKEIFVIVSGTTDDMMAEFAFVVPLITMTSVPLETPFMVRLLIEIFTSSLSLIASTDDGDARAMEVMRGFVDVGRRLFAA